jgi:excisionase family DNA binding protein
MKSDSLPAFLVALDEANARTPPEGIIPLLAALSSRVNAVTARLLTVSPEPVSSGMRLDENLSIEEAARRLGVSRDYVYRHAHKLPFTVRIGRRLLFSARGLERWNRQRQGRG